MLIAQITDIHIGFDPDNPNLGYMIDNPNGEDKAGLYEFDFTTGQIGKKLFADAATPALNKIYNQLQVSYLVFRQNHDVRMLRQDIATALEALGYQ